jgi:hypothetical protein
MIKDILSIVGLFITLCGVYFVYWPLCLIFGGLLITTYCVLTVWIETKRNNQNESD